MRENKYLKNVDENINVFFNRYKQVYGNKIENDNAKRAELEKQIFRDYWKSIYFIVAVLISICILVLSCIIKLDMKISIYKYAITIVSFIIVNYCAYSMYANKRREEGAIPSYTDNKVELYNLLLKGFNPSLKILNRQEKNEFEVINWQKEYYSVFNSEGFNKFCVDDVLVGNLRNKNINDFYCSELSVVYDTKDSKGNGKYINVFDGLFCRYEMNKNINQEIKILRDNKETESKKYYNQADANRIINMDAGEFERKFDVIADNGTAAMSIITADIMQMLLELYDEMKFEIVIKNQYIYVKLFGKWFFELGANPYQYIDKMRGIENSGNTVEDMINIEESRIDGKKSDDDEYKKLEIKRTYIGLAKLFEVIDMIEELVNKNL